MLAERNHTIDEETVEHEGRTEHHVHQGGLSDHSQARKSGHGECQSHPEIDLLHHSREGQCATLRSIGAVVVGLRLIHERIYYLEVNDC